MKDRIPLYPGRVKLTPVAGQENTYDMVRADQPTQEGDPLNKGTLLSDQVAELFGLSTDAVPNDLFKLLKDSVLYQSSEKSTYLSEIPVNSQFEFYGVTFTKLIENYRGVSGNTLVICENDVVASKWSDSTTGSYANEALDNYLSNTYYNSLPQEVKNALVEVDIECYSGNAPTTPVTTIKRKIFAPSAAETVKPSAPSVSDGTFIDGLLQQLKNYMTRHNQNDRFFRTPYGNRDASAMSVGMAVTSLYSYSKTTSRRAFPMMVLKSNTLLKTEIVDETYHKPNGETVPMVKIETGTYIGTGAWGNNNKTGYTFNIIPELVLLFQYSGAANSIDPFVIIKRDITSQNYGGAPLWITWETNRVSWYANNEIAQFNVQGQTYQIVGISKE